MHTLEKSDNQEVHLLIWASQGRLPYLHELLNSISSDKIQLFSNCHLSVNGSADYLSDVQQLLNDMSCSSLFNLYHTGSYVSAIEHAKAIVNCLQNYLLPDSKLLLCADDDLITATPETLSHFLSQTQSRPDSVGISSYQQFCPDAPPYDCRQALPLSAIANPVDLLRTNYTSSFSTNVTGMTISFNVLSDATSFMYALSSYGRRSELIFIAHRSVKNVFSSSNRIALIRQHPGRETAKSISISPFYDELVFILWIWTQHLGLSPFFVFTRFSRLLLKVFLYSLLRCLANPYFLAQKLASSFVRASRPSTSSFLVTDSSGTHS